MIAIIGGGAFGTAIALRAVAAGSRVRLLCPTREQADRLRREGAAAAGLGAIPLPDAVEVGLLEEGFGAAELVVAAVPSGVAAEVAAGTGAALPRGAGVLSLTKGLDPATGRRISEVWADAAPDVRLAVLSGPTHAEEVAVGLPTAAVVAGDPGVAERVRVMLGDGPLRLYRSDDLIGVELAGAAKNVIAVASGMADGMGAGDNARAALITRGLAEITRLGVACGARADTFGGLAGMGDLVATCTSGLSRNRRAGLLLAEGVPADRVEQRIGQVTEGLWTARALLRLAEGAGVELPIARQVVAAAFEGRPVAECAEELMSREAGSEF